MLIILIVALIGGVLLLLAVVSTLNASYDESVQRQQLDRRVRQAKQEVEAIGRETRAASRLKPSGGRGIDGDQTVCHASPVRSSARDIDTGLVSSDWWVGRSSHRPTHWWTDSLVSDLVQGVHKMEPRDIPAHGRRLCRERVGRRHRHVRNLRRRTDALDGEIEVALIKKERLERLGRTMLEAIAGLSAREAVLSRAYPTGAERYQYIVDAVTHEMGQALADLTRRWQTSDQPAVEEVKGTKRL